MKTCSRCKQVKALTLFYKSQKYRCKECCKAIEVERRKKDPSYLARWRAQHPSAYKDWYQNNKQHKAEYFSVWRADHIESEPYRYKQWYLKNRHRVYASIAKRRAAMFNATPIWANHLAIAAIYKEADRLTKERGQKYDVDHIVPLQSPLVSGLHWEGNLQLLPKRENISKKNRRWPDMPC